jgi:hypothetical protein
LLAKPLQLGREALAQLLRAEDLAVLAEISESFSASIDWKLPASATIVSASFFKRAATSSTGSAMPSRGLSPIATRPAFKSASAAATCALRTRISSESMADPPIRLRTFITMSTPRSAMMTNASGTAGGMADLVVSGVDSLAGSATA